MERKGKGPEQEYLREDALRVRQPRGLRLCDARTRSARQHHSKWINVLTKKDV